MANTNRTKGHNLEREIARMFKEELSFKFAKTARYASTMLDNCKVDISGVPFLIQTKMGYVKARPKAEEIFQEMEDLLKENFPEEDKVHSYPKVLIHKMNGKKKGYHNLVTMPYNDWKFLINKIKDQL